MSSPESLRSHPDFESIRSSIHRLQKPEHLAVEITDIRHREDIRDRCYAGMPLANRFDLSDDKQFVGSLLIARGHFNSLPDYENHLSNLVEVILEKRNLQRGIGIHAAVSVSEAAPDIAKNMQDVPDPVGARIASTAPGFIKTVDVASEEPVAAQRVGKSASMKLFEGYAPADCTSPLSLLGVRAASDTASLMKWISGDTEKEFPYLPVIQISSEEMDTDLATLEIDVRADPDSFLSSQQLRAELEPRVLPELGRWMREQAYHEDLPFCDETAFRTRSAFETVVARLYPDQPEQLRGVHARLHLSEKLKGCFAFACALEDHFLSDIDATDEPSSRQLIEGSISEKCRISEGLLLQRAFACHLMTGYPMDTALCMSALEMRYAQALRVVGWDADPDPLIDFDERFLEDCKQPVSSYTISENPVMEM